ncbi:WD repeat-containing protein 41-like isoform X2 [Gigantopelta aegis]|uniref:WD repeat-containing protein 41-like isoform X2 n=1 Tax=Gigantopelta aegis TaxID=1735272 RepID=UPI001B887C42|nr:WD repeat-containing protein 41-like isoform X2 [Gigantopelta aegis]
MSMFQRFLNLGSATKEKEEPKLNQSTVEELSDGQPYNPYTEILVLQEHKDIVRSLLKIDKYRCVSVADDCKAVIWDIHIGQRLAVLSGHTHPITCMLLLKPQTNAVADWLLVTGSSDKLIKVWDISTGYCHQSISDHASSVRCLVSLTEDCQLFCSGGESLAVWQHDGRLLHAYTRGGEEEDISFMIVIQNERVVTAADKIIVVYSVITPEDGGEPDDKKIRLVKKLPPHREAIHSLINISESCFASGSIDGTIILWTTQNLIPAKYFNTVTEYVGDAKLYPYSIQSMFCAQEKYLFATIGSGFCVFDVSVGQERLMVKKLAAHYSKILHIGFACDGAYLVTCSEDGSIRLWGKTPISDDSGSSDRDICTLGPMERFTGLRGDQLRQCCHSDNLLEPSLLGECTAHSGSVQMFLDFDHEGLVSCGGDNLLIVWKNAEMQKIQRNQKVQEILFSRDGIV